MGSILGGPGGGSSNFPSWTAPFTRFAFTGATPNGRNPPTQGLIGDAYWGGQAAPSQHIFGGLMDQAPNAQRAGANIRDLAAIGANQGFGNAMTYANGAMFPAGQAQNVATLVPGGIDAANAYMNMVTRAIGQGSGDGAGIQGAQTARVTDAALGQLRNAGIDGDLYNRAADLLTPRVRASFSARGMGTSGSAIQGENDAMQSLADSFAQRAMQERIGLLGAAGNAAGAEASERVGLTDAMVRQALGLGGLNLQGGTLALQAAGMPGQILNQMQGVNSGALDALTSAMGLQSGPLALTGLGGQVYNQGLNLPLDYQQSLYNFTRSPALSLLGGLSGTQLQNSDYRGLFGVPK